MARTLIHSTDWLVLNQADESTVEIDITGIIGGGFWFEEDDPKSLNTREKMRAELKALAEIKASKIIVNIDSPGGDVAHGLSIHDLLAQHPAEKEVRIIGMTASIASVIAQCGQKRKMSNNALLLPHKASTFAMGNINDLKADIELLEAVDNRIKSIYVKRGSDEEKITEILESNNGNGKWLDANEALEIGLIDEVTEPFRAAAVYDKQIFNKLKYPELPKINNMNENEVKTFGEKLDGFLADLKAIFTPKEEKPEQPEKSPELVTALAEVERLKAELAQKQTAVDEAATVKAEAETAKAEALESKTKTEALIEELKNLKNTWKPEARSTTTSEANNIDKVKEILAKAKENQNK